MSDPKTKKQQLMEVVAKELVFMKSPSGEAKRIASLYRHSVDKEPGEVPELFGRLIQELPEGLKYSRRAEEAAYTALTLAAFVGNHGDESLTKAISEIENNENIVKRFRFAEKSKDINEMRYNLRKILKIIAYKERAVNYAYLAADLYEWQYSKASQIRRWERGLVK